MNNKIRVLPKLTEAQSLLVTETIKDEFVKKMIWKEFPRLCYDIEDIYSIGHLALCRAAIFFDPSRGIKFQTFAYKFIKFDIIHYIIKSNRIKTVSLDDVMSYYNSIDHTDIEEEALNRVTVSSLSSYLLPSEFKLIKLMYLEGYKIPELAAIFNIPYKRMDNRITRIRSKIRRIKKKFKL